MTVPAERPHVLLVDDSPMVLKALGMLMNSLGWQATTSDNAAQALEQVDLGLFTLVILDFKMADMNGIELCREIQLRTKSRAPVIFLLSGYIDTRCRMEAENAGVRAILEKPVGRAELIDILKAHGLPCQP